MKLKQTTKQRRQLFLSHSQESGRSFIAKGKLGGKEAGPQNLPNGTPGTIWRQENYGKIEKNGKEG